MKIVMFYHSLVSDWNHGNAHFLRGIVTEMLSRGHDVKVFEPRNSWSVQNLVAEYGLAPIAKFCAAYPGLTSDRYTLNTLDLEAALDSADMVLVHEWNDPSLIRQIGRHRARGGKYALFFHDTHHRVVSDSGTMSRLELDHYDGVLAYGAALRQLYVESGRIGRAWIWHEAADTRIFRPFPAQEKEGDLVWVGNWGDDERSAELNEFLLGPCRQLSLKARVYGVRYPDPAKAQLSEAGLRYTGWLPNFEVPRVFSHYRVTIHIPRRPYVQALPGIPTIRPFETLACRIPLICAPWQDSEHLFSPGSDFLIARDGEDMTRKLRDVLADAELRRSLSGHGLATIHARHTCAHRTDELLRIYSEVRRPAEAFTPEPSPAVSFS